MANSQEPQRRAEPAKASFWSSERSADRDPASNGRRRSSWLRVFWLLLLPAAVLPGCAGTDNLATVAPGTPPVLPSAEPAYAAESFVGRWGLGAYHRDADKTRTEKIAGQQCKDPYVIKAGPNGGLMMYLADDPELRELKVKGAVGGRTFIGPDGPPGGEWDREIVSFDRKVLTTKWVDDELAGRYGTMVMVRCS
jgi:hypothetical protein